MGQDYWRGGWANAGMQGLPGTQGAAAHKVEYNPLHALADILGAYWQKKKTDATAKALNELYDPVQVNTGDVISTPQFGDMSLQNAIGNRGGQSVQDMAQSVLSPNAGSFGTPEWYAQNVQAQAPQQTSMPQVQQAPVQPVQQGNPAVNAQFQKDLQEHPEWFDLNGNYMGNTYYMHDGVSDSNLDPLTARKLNLLSRDFKEKWGEALGTTSMRRHGDGSSWHDSGQAFDVAGGILETNPEARAWAVEQAAKYGLVPLDEYANPSPHATGGHLHFSDHGDALTNNYNAPAPQQGQPNNDFNAWFEGMAQQESGGDYNARNSDTGASGRYQIMPENWAPWSQEAGLPEGSEMTPENQDAVAKYKMKQYYDQYGPEGALVAWYSGPENGRRWAAGETTDVWGRAWEDPQSNGPSISQYVQEAMGHAREKGYGSSPQNAPQNAQQAPQQQITMPQDTLHAQPQKQLHQATAAEPWTDRYNTKADVLRSFDDAWSRKMDAIAKANPEMLQDRGFMQQVMAMREDARDKILGEWQKTETNRNWDKFRDAYANGNYKDALFLAVKNGMDMTGVKVLMSPDYNSQLVDFGGEKRIVSQNQYTGDILVNGHAPTQNDLAMTLTPQNIQAQQNADRTFNYQKQRDAIADEHWNKTYALNTAKAAASGEQSDETGYKRAKDAFKMEADILKEWVNRNKNDLESAPDVKNSPNYAAYLQRYKELIKYYPELANQPPEAALSMDFDGGGEKDNTPVAGGLTVSGVRDIIAQAFKQGKSKADIEADIATDFPPEAQAQVKAILDEMSSQNNDKINPSNYLFADPNMARYQKHLLGYVGR